MIVSELIKFTTRRNMNEILILNPIIKRFLSIFHLMRGKQNLSNYKKIVQKMEDTGGLILA